MKTTVVPLPTRPEALLAKLRVVVPTAVAPAFDQALLAVQTRVNQLSEALIQGGEPDTYGANSQALYSGMRDAGRDFRAKLIEAIDALAPDASGKKQKSSLSLIEDEHMQAQLVCERLVERLSYVQRKGLLALDGRLCKVLESTPLGPRMPLSPQVFADAAREALSEMTLDDEFKAQIIQHFDLLLDPILSDLLKEMNGGLAAAGILPDLVIQDAEERIRRQSIKSPPPVAVAADSAAAAGANSTGAGNTGGMVNNAAPIAENTGHYNRTVDDNDRTMLSELMAQIKSMAARAMPTGFSPSANSGDGAAPQRAMAKSETLAMLDKLQHGSNNTSAVLDAIGKPDGSIADTIKRELLQSANQAGMTSGGEQASLAPEEDTAVQLAGNLFEVMLKDRPYGDAVAPVLAQMMLPFVRAAVQDPQLFLERHHPARQLLNTVSEACEDNLGETPQERELLSQVETAVQRISQEYDGDVSKFQDIEAQLSSQMQTHRRRAEMSQKRASEAQQGQERLEIARTRATSVVNAITRQYALPPALRHYFNTEWQHHLSITALRKSEESDAFISATRIAQPWIALLDMVSLGEALPLSHLDALETATLEVLASSGIQDDAAIDHYQSLINSVSEWTEVIVDTEFAGAKSYDTGSPSSPALTDSTQEQVANATSVIESSIDTSELSDATQGLRPSENELKEVGEYVLGSWVQLPKAGGGYQQLKVAWISGISGSILFVNRRGARMMVLSPPEMVALKRRNELLLFENESPVDQAMAQLLDKLKRH